MPQQVPTSSITLPHVPVATDLQSCIAAINALRLAVQLLAGQLGAVTTKSSGASTS